MGVDFCRNKTRSFKKSWSGGAAKLSEPTLFTRYPECRSRSVLASLVGSANLQIGTELVVHVDGSSLALVRDTARVGTVPQPPADLLTAINGAGGCALGRVSQLNPMSETANVEIE